MANLPVERRGFEPYISAHESLIFVLAWIAPGGPHFSGGRTHNGGPTTFDRVLSSQYGAHDVRLIVEKKFGQMVCYEPPNILDAPIADAVGDLRTVDRNGSAVLTARAMGICFGDTPGYVNPFKMAD